MARLASTFIADAGKPQKIYTVPTGKVLSGHITLFNKTGQSVVLQVKRDVGIVAPAASFPFSNANQIGPVSNMPTTPLYDLDPLLVAQNGSELPAAFDLTDPTTPVKTTLNQNIGWPRDPAAWGAADRLCISEHTELKRIGGSFNPWTVGQHASEAQVQNGVASAMNGVSTKVGWGQYAIAFGETQDTIAYNNAVPTTGTVAWSSDTFANMGLDPAHVSYWSANFVNVHVANGVVFIDYPFVTDHQYSVIAAIQASSIANAAQWSKIAGDYSLHRGSNGGQGLWGVFHGGGYYWFFFKDSTYVTIYRVAEADVLNNSTPGLTAVAFAYAASQYGQSFYRESLWQLANGHIFWRAGAHTWLLDPVTATLTQNPASLPVADLTLPANYEAYVNSKLTPVTWSTLHHTVPRAGTGDPANDRIAYTNAGIIEFVTDDTWSLQDVADDAGWIDYDLGLANKGEAEYRGRMFNADDEIWVRSSRAGLTVSVEGFLLDAAA